MSVSYPQRQRELEKLIEKLGLPDSVSVRWDLLELALTHPSASSEENYEQLEFMGDAVVRLAASEFLLERYPTARVGEMAKIRSVLVSDRILAQIAASYGLERYLLLSPSAAGDRSGQQSRLADAFEALLAVLYLSTHTLELVRPWLDSHFQQLAEDIRKDPALRNYKDALQEWTQLHYKVLPEYRVREIHPLSRRPHRFKAEVWLQGERKGEGSGRSKKAAQQAAAKVAFLSLCSESAIP
ncbi:ribonuclease III [Phormidium sp. CCY1219]|uniref:ribonuclease III n=1 Tax=Phormidium sp. CCY1219 TaxID=2886104 RepID=UPI002D1E5CE4|nr:ribonuclease III [Phormidium sp. CCY1219]MEB3828033.1 ribonuclease III [Phormidium sp. CCY1219]